MFSYCAAICNNGTDSEDRLLLAEMKQRNDGTMEGRASRPLMPLTTAVLLVWQYQLMAFKPLSMRYDSHRAFNTITIAINPASARLAISENVPCNGCEWKYRLRDFFACIMAIPITEWRQGFSCRRAHMCNTIVSERFSISLLK